MCVEQIHPGENSLDCMSIVGLASEDTGEAVLESGVSVLGIVVPSGVGVLGFG